MTRTSLPESLRFGANLQELRTAVRGWCAAHDPGPPPDDYDAHMAALIRWQHALAEAGFVGLSWPREYGGQGMGLAAEAVLAEELAATSLPELVNRLALYTWGPTIMQWGTAAQRARFLPGMLDASEIWCQSFSEPDAGSDLSAVATRAVADGDELVLTGHKIWTSRASLSRWNAMLVRTDTDAPPRAGLSLLIVDMSAPGITLRPLPQILHEPHFFEVFLDDVRVPADHVLGGVGQGWAVAMSAMAYERGLFVLERSIRLHRRLAQLGSAIIERGMVEDPQVIATVGDLVARLEFLRAQVYRSLAAQEAGSLPRGLTSVDKLLLADADQHLFAAAFDLFGADHASSDGWSDDLLRSRSVSIYSGTSEIQYNVIARQLLDLPASS